MDKYIHIHPVPAVDMFLNFHMDWVRKDELKMKDTMLCGRSAVQLGVTMISAVGSLHLTRGVGGGSREPQKHINGQNEEVNWNEGKRTTLESKCMLDFTVLGSVKIRVKAKARVRG